MNKYSRLLQCRITSIANDKKKIYTFMQVQLYDACDIMDFLIFKMKPVGSFISVVKLSVGLPGSKFTCLKLIIFHIRLLVRIHKFILPIGT